MPLPKPLSPWKPQCLNPISILLKHPAGRSNRLRLPEQGPVYWQSSCRVLLLTLDSNLTHGKCPTIIDTEGSYLHLPPVWRECNMYLSLCSQTYLQCYSGVTNSFHIFIIQRLVMVKKIFFKDVYHFLRQTIVLKNINL